MSLLTDTFSQIANAIRNKGNTTDLITPLNMANAINNIETTPSVFTVDQPIMNFNSPVVIPNSVTSMINFFRYCYRFDQNVTVPDAVTTMRNCFNGCVRFDKPIAIPNSVTDLKECFSECDHLNQQMIIPNSVTNMFGCFYNCKTLNAPIIVSNSVSNLRNCFYSCTSFSRYIRIYGEYRSIAVAGMLNNCNNSRKKELRFNFALNNQFNRTTASASVTGTAIKWTDMTNGFYNEAYNIYCYYNYSV